MNDVEERIKLAFEPYRSKKDLADLSEPSSTRRGQPRRSPAYPEEPIPATRTSTRVVTAIVAFAIFAVAILVFLLPALRLHTAVPGVASPSGDPLLLWPVQTASELQRYQDGADAGQHPEALDPKTLAESFGHRVLGWDQVFAVLHTEPISSLCGAAVPGDPAPGFAVGCWSPGLPGQYPATEDQPGYTPAPMETFALLPCEPGPCDLKFYSPVDVTVYQPLDAGSNGVWAVMAASNAWLNLTDQPGNEVRDGSSISVDGSIAFGDDFRFGVAGVGDCSYAMSTGSYHSHGPPGPTLPLSAPATVDLGTSTGCSPKSPGYLWAAESSSPLKGVDPLKGGGPALTGFSAVPVTLVVP
jgi:hypothetical protein